MPSVSDVQAALGMDVGLSIGGMDLRAMLTSLVGEVLRLEKRLEEAKEEIRGEVGQACEELGGRIDTVNTNFTLYQSLMTARTEDLTRSLDEQRVALHMRIDDLDAQTSHTLSTQRSELERALEQQRIASDTQLRTHQATTLRSFAETAQQIVTSQRAHRHQAAHLLLSRTDRDLRSVYYNKLDCWRALQKRRFTRYIAQRNVLQKVLSRINVESMRVAYHRLEEHMRARRRYKTVARNLRTLSLDSTRAHLRHALSRLLSFRIARQAARASRHARLQATLTATAAVHRRGYLACYFATWTRYLRRRRALAVRLRATEEVAAASVRACKQEVWDRWAAKHRRWRHVQAARTMGVPKLEAAAASTVLARYYGVFMRFHGRCVRAKAVEARVRAVAAAADEGTKERFLGLWVRRAREERVRMEREAAVRRIAREALVPMKDRYFQRWGEYMRSTRQAEAAVRKKRGAQVALVYLLQRSENALRGVFWRLWRRWIAGLHDDRRRARHAEHLRTLETKNDALWTQLEIHQKTVTNTNSCVHRLVDKLVAVDESLDKLEKSKAGRRELNSVVESITTVREPPPPAVEYKNVGAGRASGGGTGGDRSLLKDIASFLPPPPPPLRVGDEDIAAAQESALRLSAILDQSQQFGEAAVGGRRETLPMSTSPRHAALRRAPGATAAPAGGAYAAGAPGRTPVVGTTTRARSPRFAP